MHLAREGLKAPLSEGWKPCRSAAGELCFMAEAPTKRTRSSILTSRQDGSAWCKVLSEDQHAQKVVRSNFTASHGD